MHSCYHASVEKNWGEASIVLQMAQRPSRMFTFIYFFQYANIVDWNWTHHQLYLCTAMQKFFFRCDTLQLLPLNYIFKIFPSVNQDHFVFNAALYFLQILLVWYPLLVENCIISSIKKSYLWSFGDLTWQALWTQYKIVKDLLGFVNKLINTVTHVSDVGNL